MFLLGTRATIVSFDKFDGKITSGGSQLLRMLHDEGGAYQRLKLSTAFLLLALLHCQWEILCVLMLISTRDVHLVLKASKSEEQVQEPQILLPPPTERMDKEIDPRISGTWQLISGIDLFENQKPAVQLLQLGGVARTAMKMFKGMEFNILNGQLHMQALTKLPFLKVSKEAYSLDGSISYHKRRDMRSGMLCGYIKTCADGGVDHYFKWEDPVAGHMFDEIRIIGGDDMTITSHITVGSETSVFRMHYKRQGHGESVNNLQMLRKFSSLVCATPLKDAESEKMEKLRLHVSLVTEKVRGVLDSEISVFLSLKNRPANKRRVRRSSESSSSTSICINRRTVFKTSHL